MKLRKIQEKRNKIQKRGKIEMRRKNRKPIASIKKLPQFTTMNVIDGQAGLENYSRLIFYSLTIDNILNIIVLLILAGVTIATLIGDNGILTKTQVARESTVVETEKEQLKTAVSATNISGYIPENQIDENYNWLETELDNIVGEGKTSVEYMEDMYEVTFLDTGNKYYVAFDYETGNVTDILTEEEAFEIQKSETTEDLDSLTSEQQEKVDKGFKADINSENGFIRIAVDEEGIVDWGDGTYSKVKDTYYGDLGKIASTNNNISVAVAIRNSILYHKYPEKNKTYNIKIYAKSIDMRYSTELQKITDWGENQMNMVWFSGCTNLTEIAPLKANSYSGRYFSGVFEGCTKLKQIPEDFFANCSNITNVSYTFSGCTSLTGNAIPLWENGNITGDGCYEGCTGLANYNEIPDGWK